MAKARVRDVLTASTSKETKGPPVADGVLTVTPDAEPGADAHSPLESCAEWRAPWLHDPEDDDVSTTPACGRFTWRIDGFTALQSSKRELRSHVFEVGSYKWYILVYPQGCDVCNHLSLFLCVADYDKLLPGWSHFAQFTIAVINQDPKKSKYSDTLHRFCKKEHDWGWKKFMELSKVADGFTAGGSLVIKAQVQVIMDKPGRPFRCLHPAYRRELLRVYLSNVESVCRRFCEEKRLALAWLSEPSFLTFWAGLPRDDRPRLTTERIEVVLKGMVKQFFSEKEVTSTLVMDAVYCGCCRLDAVNRQGRASPDFPPLVAVVRSQGLFAVLEGPEDLPARMATHLTLNPSADIGKSGEGLALRSGADEEGRREGLERDERRMLELGYKVVQMYVITHICTERLQVAYRNAEALRRQDLLIKEEDAAAAAAEERRKELAARERERRARKKERQRQRKDGRAEEEALVALATDEASEVPEASPLSVITTQAQQPEAPQDRWSGPRAEPSSSLAPSAPAPSQRRHPGINGAALSTAQAPASTTSPEPPQLPAPARPAARRSPGASPEHASPVPEVVQQARPRAPSESVAPASSASNDDVADALQGFTPANHRGANGRSRDSSASSASGSGLGSGAGDGSASAASSETATLRLRVTQLERQVVERDGLVATLRAQVASLTNQLQQAQAAAAAAAAATAAAAAVPVTAPSAQPPSRGLSGHRSWGNVPGASPTSVAPPPDAGVTAQRDGGGGCAVALPADAPTSASQQNGAPSGPQDTDGAEAADGEQRPRAPPRGWGLVANGGHNHPRVAANGPGRPFGATSSAAEPAGEESGPWASCAGGASGSGARRDAGTANAGPSKPAGPAQVQAAAAAAAVVAGQAPAPPASLEPVAPSYRNAAAGALMSGGGGTSSLGLALAAGAHTPTLTPTTSVAMQPPGCGANATPQLTSSPTPPLPPSVGSLTRSADSDDVPRVLSVGALQAAAAAAATSAMPPPASTSSLLPASLLPDVTPAGKAPLPHAPALGSLRSPTRDGLLGGASKHSLGLPSGSALVAATSGFAHADGPALGGAMPAPAAGPAGAGPVGLVSGISARTSMASPEPGSVPTTPGTSGPQEHVLVDSPGLDDFAHMGIITDLLGPDE